MAGSSRLPERSALVVYGSETGNAQEVAEDLGRLLQRLHFSPTVLELNAISVSQLLRHRLVLFAISTTGQGDLPANAQLFWKALRSTRLRVGCLRDLNFASFGLGDSSYPKFNWAHRKLYNRLVQLGAQAIYERGEADEQHPEGIDGSLISWSAALREFLLSWLPLPPGLEVVPESTFLKPKWALELVSPSPENGLSLDTHVHTNTRDSAALLPEELLPIPNTVTAELTQNVRSTPEHHWQDVRCLHFELPMTEYQPGDVATIYPKNFPSEVDELIDLMGWGAITDEAIHFVPTEPVEAGHEYPAKPVQNLLEYPGLTIRSLLINYLDITAIPRRSFFAAIAHFTDDETQKERLQEFTDPTLVDELYDYTTRPRRSILEVLQEFHTVKLPWRWIASVFPIMRGRQFSIASGGALKALPSGKTKVELLVAIVKYKTVIKKIRQGLCTRYLASLSPGARLNMLIGKGSMNTSPGKSLLLVGPGTGIAPLRSMLHERVMEAQNSATKTAKYMLFFGGRNRDADFFYHEEWEQISQSLSLQVVAVFSRDQREKHYVQDAIRKHATSVYETLKDGTIIVCGSSGKMPQAVREALIEVFEQAGELSRNDAELRLKGMEKTGRYLQETW